MKKTGPSSRSRSPASTNTSCTACDGLTLCNAAALHGVAGELKQQPLALVDLRLDALLCGGESKYVMSLSNLENGARGVALLTLQLRNLL